MSTEAVVVPGFRNRGSRANLVNRWRVRLGLRARQPRLSPSRLVLCGGAVAGDVPEAEPTAPSGTPPKARYYLKQLRPGLAARLVPAKPGRKQLRTGSSGPAPGPR